VFCVFHLAPPAQLILVLEFSWCFRGIHQVLYDGVLLSPSLRYPSPPVCPLLLALPLSLPAGKGRRVAWCRCGLWRVQPWCSCGTCPSALCVFTRSLCGCSRADIPPPASALSHPLLLRSGTAELLRPLETGSKVSCLVSTVTASPLNSS